MSQPQRKHRVKQVNRQQQIHQQQRTIRTTCGAVITLSDDGIAVDGTGATAEGSVVTISQAGEYTVTGSLSDGQIAVTLPTKIG